MITIGQTAGSIKTYSTAVKNNHLIVNLRVMENKNGSKGDNLSGSVNEEYIIDLNRTGKVLICFPGSETFRQMGPRERIYIMDHKDPSGEPAFPVLEPGQPVRIRLGDKLNQDQKFAEGYFEFHLFNREYVINTGPGITEHKKDFMLRLYRIYPGYDVSSPDTNGLYPMMSTFSSPGK